MKLFLLSCLSACAAGNLLVVGATSSNDKVCCDMGSSADQSTCKAATFPQNKCFGTTGIDCIGVPQTIDLSPVGKIEFNLAKPLPSTDGDANKVNLIASVGSIYHDLCCRKHPDGKFCNGENYDIGATLNLGGNADQDCNCLLEWRKAAWNVIRGRYWRVDVSTKDYSSDLTPVSTTRATYFPLGSGTNYVPIRTTLGIVENKATQALCAPSDTELDCPSEDDNCKVPCFGVTCTACESGCTRTKRKRWNKNGRDHAHAGDANFCCSGSFKKVYWSLSGTRYGVCK